MSPGAFAQRLADLSGWRRWALAVAAGLAAASALPPFYVLPGLFLAFPLLMFLLGGAKTDRQAAALGWCFGFGYHVLGLYWISNALLIEPERFAWLIPFAICGLPAFLGFFTGFAAWAAWRAAGRGGGLARLVAFALFYSLVEWARGWILTGFPWNLLGSVWDFSDAMIQFASIAGAQGLSLVTLLTALAPALLAEDRKTGFRAIGAALLTLSVLWGFGAWRLAEAETASVPGVRLRLVQAHVEQTNKWRDDMRRTHLVRHLTMSLEPADKPPTHILWPETAVAYYLDHDEQARESLASAAPPGGAVITGIPRITPREERPVRIWNSLQAVDDRANLIATYDKFHLVPFGEYVPLRSVLPLAKITPGAIDFSPGPGPRSIALPGLPPFSPLVCYEAIFSGEVIDEKNPPRWLLNVTNDGWYGKSAGPYQHFAQARLRAVEEGLPLVRVANTGISAFVDAEGRVLASLALGTAGILDGDLPTARRESTLFARLRHVPFFTILAVFSLFLLFARYKNAQQ